MLHRLCLTLINILFPPLTILLVTGLGMDLVLSCTFFLLGVIPSHIHGFYLTCTYFSRKKKVRKGKYPGEWKPLIYSEKVQYGGLSGRQVRQLKRDEEEKKADAERRKSEKRSSSLMSRVNSRLSGQGQVDSRRSRRDSYNDHLSRTPSQRRPLSRTPSYQASVANPSPISPTHNVRISQQTSPTQLNAPEMVQRNSFLTHTPAAPRPETTQRNSYEAYTSSMPISPMAERYRSNVPPSSYYNYNLDETNPARRQRTRSRSRSRRR